MTDPIEQRYSIAQDIVTDAAKLAQRHFQSLEQLSIESKGFQDVVSNADKEVELAIRQALEQQFPEDGIVGEEFDNTAGSSGYIWVIDPIDGTANFVAGMPCWAVVLACTYKNSTVIGVVLDPVAGETYRAMSGKGAYLNDKLLQTASATALDGGSTGVGLSNRCPREMTIKSVTALIEADGIFYRNASGALMLAYVAAGRLIGYCEPHMNAWDCLASLLMIEEAGGVVEEFEMQSMLAEGARVVTACPGVFGQLRALCDKAYQG